MNGITFAPWRAGTAKQAIVHFITAVTTEGGPDFVAPADRIATQEPAGRNQSVHRLRRCRYRVRHRPRSADQQEHEGWGRNP